MSDDYLVTCGEEDCSWSQHVEEDHSPRYAFAVGLLHEDAQPGHFTDVWVNKGERLSTHLGNRHLGVVRSEEELQEGLKGLLDSSGWNAQRELSPDGSEYRADLLAEHPDYGVVGIETKFFKNSGGAKAADAHHQIVSKYRGKKYGGQEVNLWVICPYFVGKNGGSFGRRNQQRTREKVIQEMLCRHGIGYLNLAKNNLLFDFAMSDRAKKIPVSGPNYEKYERAVDIDEIRESVSRKVKKYNY